MLLNKLEKYTDQKIDIFTIINILIYKKFGFLLVSILSIFLSGFLYFSQNKLVNAKIDIYLQSDNLINEIISKKIVVKNIESGNFISDSSIILPNIGIEGEKQLLTNLLINNVLFSSNYSEVFESKNLYRNLEEKNKNFLKQVNNLDFNSHQLYRGESHIKFRVSFHIKYLY